MKDFLYSTLIIFTLAALLFIAFLHCTSKEAWYAGKHDSKCETAGYGDCGCYDRFMKKGN